MLSKDFLVGEDGENDKLLVFATKTALKGIKNSKVFYGDGTFKIAPRPFCQCYTIHAEFNHTSKSTSAIIPVIYALLPDKSQSTYLRLFKILKNKLNINIGFYKSDYELAAMNAVQEVYPLVKKTGCFFHFKKAVWRKSKELGICNTEKGRRFTRLLVNLPLLPKVCIPEAWLTLIQKFNKVDKICQFQKYFENYWLGTVTIDVFCCENETRRTTNHLEGWHSKMNRKILRYSKLLHVIYKLKKEAVTNNLKIKDAQVHKFVTNTRKIDKKFDNSLKILTEDCLNGHITMYDFLKRAAKLSYRRKYKAEYTADSSSESDLSSSESSTEESYLSDGTVSGRNSSSIEEMLL